MLDTIAYTQALAAGTAVLQAINGAADDHVTVNGNQVIVPSQCNKIVGAIIYCGCTAVPADNPTWVQLSSPSLRATSLVDMQNFNSIVAVGGSLPITDPAYNDFKEAPIELMPGEALQALIANGAGGGAVTPDVIVFLTDGNLATPLQGRIESIRCTATAAAVARTWTNDPLVFTQALRAGTYAVVGMKFQSTTGLAARLVFGNQGARPGTPGCPVITAAGITNVLDPARGIFRYGRLGVWGTFSHINPPVAQKYCVAADAAAVGTYVLDVIKIA